MTKEEYTKQHNKLMQNWKKRDLHSGKSFGKKPVFIEDGIIDFDRWSKVKRKVLFLLKEAYQKEQGDEDWSLTELIRNNWQGPKHKVWWTVSYWLYVLQKSDKNHVPNLPRNETEFAECKEYLLSSAVVNIKKSSGRSRSVEEDLSQYLNEDKDLLYDQIALINPDIIICGYTFEYLRVIMKTTGNEIEDSDGIVFQFDKIMAFDYWHPANQFPEKLCYYTLGHFCQKCF